MKWTKLVALGSISNMKSKKKKKNEVHSRASWGHFWSKLRALKLTWWVPVHEGIGLHDLQTAKRGISRAQSSLPIPALEAPYC